MASVQYLNSAGIHIREIPGIDALARAYPDQWLLYASLQCYPAQGAPIEIDAMVVMDDRVLLLEIKDWNGKLTHNGDQWLLNGRQYGRSPVDIVSMKAKKVKTILSQQIPGFSKCYVDSRVVLTGSATKSGLSAAEQDSVWSLQEACLIATPAGKSALLQRTKLTAKKVFLFKPEFDRITRNARLWQPQEALWDGYRVVEEDLVVHPQWIWREHRAERVRDPRYKALLRIWSFDRLGPGLNSAEHRRFIADRESRAIGHLHDLGSQLLQEGAILSPAGDEKEEILTQHFDLRTLSLGWTTLDRFLERMQGDMSVEDRLIMATRLLSIISNLHSAGIAHRDLGFRCIWTGGATKVAISGFMACQIPNDQSLDDWGSKLRGYSEKLPEDDLGSRRSSGKQRDVYTLGKIIYQVVSGKPMDVAGYHQDAVGILAAVGPTLERATSANISDRYEDAQSMADAFASSVEQINPKVDQSALDRAETADIPYVLWPVEKMERSDARVNVYRSQIGETGERIIVKIWPGLRRGMQVATDLAMLRLFEGVARLTANPIPGLPRYIRAGLSSVGPFVVYRYEDGDQLEQAMPSDAVSALDITERLIRSVDALHSLDCSHGDVASKNILRLRDANEIVLLDLFDLSQVGDGQVRTPNLCPEGWEKLTDKQLDRYAVIKIAHDLISGNADTDLSAIISTLEAELERPAIETFEPVATTLKKVSQKLAGSQLPRFPIATPEASEDFFRSDQGKYYLRVRRLSSVTLQYSIAGVDRELILEVSGQRPPSFTFSDLTYASLMHAVQQGRPIEIIVDITKGPKEGFDNLLKFIQEQIPAPAAQAVEKIREERAVLDVPRYWRKLIDLEEEFQPQIEILKDVGSRGGMTAYSYERLGGDFDFDDDSVVEVRLPSGRKVGEVDLSQTDQRTLVIRFPERALLPGDHVNLLDRRAKASLDRRRKGVNRILENRAAIPDLIGYFSPTERLANVDFGLDAIDSDLDQYSLNEGQKAAFKHVVRYGPVGLLQGPPGTGKTWFIAALVHWLITRTGAKKILVASQSHEAVNNAIENLVDLFKERGGRPNLLRIGSKGITEKIQPYHTAALRDRFNVRFEGAFKNRVTLMGAAVGLRRLLVEDAIKVDREVGRPVRRLQALAAASNQDEPTTAEDRRINDNAIRTTRNALNAAVRTFLGEEFPPVSPVEMLDAAYESLLVKHSGSSPGDLSKARKLIELSHEWTTSLASSNRNFEEFLAKTRTIVTATCVGVGQTKIRIDANVYDWVIVDEAARCAPGELAVPIQIGRRVLLVGDHLQLKPMLDGAIVKRLEEEIPDAPRQELTRSDFERAYTSTFGIANGQILTEQYRMTPAICRLVSSIFYEPNNVMLDTSPDRENDNSFSSVTRESLTVPLVWVDTSNDPHHSERKAEWNEHSYWNQAEIDAALQLLERIAAEESLVANLSEVSSEGAVGIICMYSAQKVKLEQAFSQRSWESKFRKLVRIDTVDSYQGKENKIVIVSLVRSNAGHEAGHVSSSNRCNVALSRARERLFIIGNQKMWERVGAHQPMRRVLEYLRQSRAADSKMLSPGDL